MKYTARKIDEYSLDGNDPHGPIRENTTITSTTESLDVFLNVVKDYIDPSSYELTEENIMKEFPHFSPEGVKTVVNYYGYRNTLWECARRWIDENKTSNKKADFHADFPQEVNWFSEDGKPYTPEKQIESSLCLVIKP